MAFLKDPVNLKYFHGEEQVDTSWPSPRSWTYLSTLLNELGRESEKNLSTNIIDYLAQNAVGKEAATKLSAFYNIYSKINIEEIFKNAFTFRLNDYDDDSITKKYIIAFAATRYYLSHYISKKNKPDDDITRRFYQILNVYAHDAKEYFNMIISSIVNNSNLNFIKNTVKIRNEINPDIFTDIIMNNEDIKDRLDEQSLDS
jgi:hypothetical protein